MTKPILLCFVTLVAVLAVAVEPKKQMGKLVRLHDTVQELNATILEGKWFAIFESQRIHETFGKGCACPAIVFHQSANKSTAGGLGDKKNVTKTNATEDDIDFIVNAHCFNQSTNRLVSANGTLDQVSKEQLPGAFRLDFQRLLQKDQQKNQTGDKDDEGEEEEHAQGCLVGRNNINFLIMKIVPQKQAMFVSGPTVNTAWILSKQQLSDNDVKPLLDFAREKGFSTLTKSSCPKDVRERMEKMKAA
jgi:lipocalin